MWMYIEENCFRETFAAFRYKKKPLKHLMLHIKVTHLTFTYMGEDTFLYLIIPVGRLFKNLSEIEIQKIYIFFCKKCFYFF